MENQQCLGWEKENKNNKRWRSEWVSVRLFCVRKWSKILSCTILGVYSYAKLLLVTCPGPLRAPEKEVIHASVGIKGPHVVKSMLSHWNRTQRLSCNARKLDLQQNTTLWAVCKEPRLSACPPNTRYTLYKQGLCSKLMYPKVLLRWCILHISTSIDISTILQVEYSDIWLAVPSNND